LTGGKEAMRFVILALLLAAWPAEALSGSVQDDRKWAEALLAHQRQSGSKDSAERARGVSLLGEATDEKHDKACLQLVGAQLRQELGRDPQGRNEERVAGAVLEACVGALQKIRQKDVVADMLRLARNRAESLPVRVHVIWGLARAGAPQDLSELADDRTPQIQVAAVDALCEKGAAAADALMKILNDPKRPWEARVGAVRGLEKIGGELAVEALLQSLAAMKAEPGRPKDDVVRSLWKAAGIDLATDDPALWREAWDAKKKGQAAPAAAANAPPGEVPIEFFGIQARSARVVFVLDRTGSMSSPFKAAAIQARKLPPKDPAPGAKEPHQDVAARNEADRIRRKHASRALETRMDAFKREFIQAVWDLEGHVWFGVVWYEANVQPWKDRLVQATWPNKLEIISEVDRIQPSGGTNIWAGLEFALRMAGSDGRPDSVQVDKRGNYTTLLGGADTIFLMTDGAHNVGEFVNDKATTPMDACEKDEFVAEVRKLNRLRRIRIHTVCLGGGSPSQPDSFPDPDLMKRIADETGGLFAHVRG